MKYHTSLEASILVGLFLAGGTLAANAADYHVIVTKVGFPSPAVGATPCTLPWGPELVSGASVEGYAQSSVAYPSTCVSVAVRGRCENGVLVPSTLSQSCDEVPSVALAPVNLPSVIPNAPYSYDFNSLLSIGDSESAVAGSVTWSLVSGQLPGGLTLDGTTGVLSGKVATPSSTKITVAATYKKTNGQQAYQLVVANLTMALAGQSFSTMQLQSPVAFDFGTKLTVTGDPSYTSGQTSWSVLTGTLPQGLTLSPAGVLSGTVTAFADGGNNVTLQATYRSNSATQSYTFGAVDPYFSYVTSLLHMEGVPGSVSISDVKGNAVSVNQGSLSATDKKYGATSYYNTGPGYLSLPSSVLNFGTGDFTVEMWVKLLNPGNAYNYLFSNNVGGTALVLRFGDSGYGRRLQTIVGADPANLAASPTWTNSNFANAWHHVAVTRAGTLVRTFVDGTLSYSQTSGASIGGGGFVSIGNGSSMYVDEFRATKGIARYTSNFTPPAYTLPSQ